MSDDPGTECSTVHCSLSSRLSRTGIDAAVGPTANGKDGIGPIPARVSPSRGVDGHVHCAHTGGAGRTRQDWRSAVSAVFARSRRRAPSTDHESGIVMPGCRSTRWKLPAVGSAAGGLPAARVSVPTRTRRRCPAVLLTGRRVSVPTTNRCWWTSQRLAPELLDEARELTTRFDAGVATHRDRANR